jgi:hypothetical protein
MTKEEHRRRHVDLHEALDELMADWALHQPRDGTKLYSNTTITELMKWSFEQTQNPREFDQNLVHIPMNRDLFL